MSHSLGIVGAGNMAEAIVRGLLAAGMMSSDAITAADPNDDRRAVFRDTLGTQVAVDPADATRAAVLLLSVKPQKMADVFAALRGTVATSTLVVSIAAGVTTARIEAGLETPGLRVVRCMPNTPMLVGCGASAIAPGTHATAADLAIARRLFESAGLVVDVEERLMDAVTALSGSGPAYVFFLVEQMTRAGVEMGLPPSVAETLARQTISGAGLMLQRESTPAEELRRRVTSPGGTTQAAVESMQAAGWPAITVDAIRAAERRGRELSGLA